MPLIHGLQSTDILKAFILNSISSALVIVRAISVQGRFDKYKDSNNEVITHTTTFKSIILTIIAAFITSMLAYMLMYFLFGYGSGMTTNSTQKLIG